MTTDSSLNRLEAGSVLGHFKLSKVIGAGGMGLVFEAVDIRLERAVAVKVLSPDLFRNDVARARFIREAKLAAAISHPNVATIHEIDEQDGTPFIAMELVPGANLKDLLRDGPLGAPDVLNIGKQVCEALQVAHSQGVIHRDIKSSNIMVTPSRQVKVLDFGLAKALERYPEVKEEDKTRERPLVPDGDESPRYAENYKGLTTAHGVALGTPSYMSPEQASGAPVDARTDIFSLGVVLYEAISGRLPFDGKSDRELLHAIRSKDPTPLKVESGQVPREFSKVVSTCLSKAPEHRYSSAKALRGDLERLEKGLGWRHRLVQPLTQTVAGRVGLVAAIVFLLAFLIRPLFEPGNILPPGAEIVLAGLDNQTGDQTLDSVQTLLEMLLRESAHYSIMSRSEMRDALKKMVLPDDHVIDLDVARNIAWREQNPLVVGASLLSMGSDFVLTARIDRIGDSPSPEAEWSKSFRVNHKEQLYDAVDRASSWIRRTIGEAAEELESLSTLARDATTPSWEALDFFVRAEKMNYLGRVEEARALLMEALELDPDFALAWGRLADISFAMDQAQIYSYHRRALDAMSRREITKNEELRIKAVFAHDSQNYPEALKHFRAYATTYPRDFVALTGYAYSLTHMERYDEALQKLKEAEPLRPEAFTTFMNSSRVSLALGRFEEVENYIEHMMDLGMDETAFYVQGQWHYVRGNYQQSADFFDRLIRSGKPYWERRGIAQLSELLIERGQWRAAESVLREALVKELGAGRSSGVAENYLALAQLHFERGELEACKNACLEAVKHERGAVRLLRAGSLLGQAGYLEEAARIRDEIPLQDGVTVYDRARHRIRGEILLSQGDLFRSLEELEKARALDAPARQDEYLARALSASGEDEKARAIYRRIADNLPALLWHTCLRRHPGLWAKALFRYAELSFEAGEMPEARNAFETYLTLRESADEEIAEVHRARELLAQTEAGVESQP